MLDADAGGIDRREHASPGGAGARSAPGPARVVIACSWNRSAVSWQFRELARALTDLGWEAHFLDDRREVAPGTDGIAHVHHWPGSGRPDSLRAVAFARGLVHRLRPRLTIGNFGAVTPLVVGARLGGVPRRMCWYHTTMGQLAMDRAGDRPTRVARDALLRRRRRLVYGLHTDVVAVSAAAARDFRQVFGWGTASVSHQHNGVADTAPVREAADPAAPIVTVGRLDASKGKDVLLRAVASMDSPRRVVVVGDGPERGALSALGHELGLEVDLLGELSNDAARTHMASASVVAVPSRDDAFGLTAAEGMAAGVPVVASRVGGLQEVVVDQVEGALVPPDDPRALAAALVHVLDPERNEAMGRAARAGYLDRFELRARARQIAGWIGPPDG